VSSACRWTDCRLCSLIAAASGSATAPRTPARVPGDSDYGFTGQRSDVTTGLQYSGSRFYDPSAGQFVSADTMLPGNGLDPLGLSRYAYVEGNPVDRTDPTGHRFSDGNGGCAFLNPNTGVTTYYTNAPPSQQYPRTVYRIPASPGFRPTPRPASPPPASRPAPTSRPRSQGTGCSTSNLGACAGAAGNWILYGIANAVSSPVASSASESEAGPK
jgi:RHS repeat-associated protein